MCIKKYIITNGFNLESEVDESKVTGGCADKYKELIGVSITSDILFNEADLSKEEMNKLMCEVEKDIVNIIDEKYKDKLTLVKGQGKYIDGYTPLDRLKN